MDDDMPGGRDDWEDQFLDQLIELLKGMNLDIDKTVLKSMMEQFRRQFEQMGLDPEKLARGDVKLNVQADLSDLAKLFGAGSDPMELFRAFISQLGGSSREPPVVEVEEDDVAEPDAEVAVPDEDLLIDGKEMSLTLDVSRAGGLEDSNIELELAAGGLRLHIKQRDRAAPVQRVRLPLVAGEVVRWALNNGILDVTLRVEDDEPPRGGDIPIL